jgi:TetR/AcrR family transcriptional regulator, transcriptional repressor for nem operon
VRYSTEHKQQTRARILGAAARVFREGGYGGAGIDGLTKAAGVTNGAFYGHFRTKAEAFRATLSAGLAEVRRAVGAARAEHGPAWLPRFVHRYLGPLQALPLAEACVLPTLSAEAMRGETESREIYQAGLMGVVEEIAEGLPDLPAPAREEAALVLLSLLAGGAMLARAVADPALASRINAAVARHAAALPEG